ncbi:MAG TPA: zf-HC2 domain-containing protein [Pyrinomonadaceae bacterium]|nr:zf-HC2 domain-containing protein [Pyrinomonadaceae bacterium]
MKLTSEELKVLYRGRTARSSHDQQCPGADELMQVATGDLSPIERERVVNHLAACSDCAEEYQVIGSLGPWVTEQAAGLEEPAIINNQTRQPSIVPAVVRRLPREENARTVGQMTSWWPGRRAFLAPMHFRYSIPALLILTIVIGAIAVFLYREKGNLVARFDESLATRDRVIATKDDEIAAARRQIEESKRLQQEEAARRLKSQERPTRAVESTRGRPVQRRENVEPWRPQLNVPIIDLDPGDSVRSGSNATQRTIQIPADTNMFTLILNINGDPQASTYSLEIHNRRGALVWRGGGLRKSQYNTFTLALTRRAIPAGEYQIKLYGLSDSRRELIESYSVRIQYH